MLYCINVVARDAGGQVIVELTAPVLRLVESYPISFADDGHFLIIVPIDFQFYWI